MIQIGIHTDNWRPLSVGFEGACEKIAAAGIKHRRVLGTAAPDAAFAKEYLAKGFRMICFGTDVGLLQSALSQRIAAMRA